MMSTKYYFFIILFLFLISGCANSDCPDLKFKGAPDDFPIAYSLEMAKVKGETYVWPLILSEEDNLCYHVFDTNEKLSQKGKTKVIDSVEKEVQGTKMKFFITDLNISIKENETFYLSRIGKSTATKKVMN